MLSPNPQNNYSIIHYHFLSFCRLQQLAMPSRLTVVLVSLLLATPAGIFCVWLVILSPRASILCPEQCWCGTAGYNATCNFTYLNPLPLNHLTDVRVLRLPYNKITFLEKDSFVSLTQLEELDMYSCGLRKIKLGAFNGLTKLTGLSIGGNEISEITSGTFNNMKNLENIDLSNNRLEHLDSDVFSGLVNLKYVDLSENSLHYLHPDTFLGLPNLQKLFLSYNPTLTIPTDRNFINSHSLSHLDISDCNASSLSVETFANVSALELLDLSYNNLRTVDINILRALPKLSSLYLHVNPLQCDCQLQEVWRWCKDHNIQTEKWYSAPECDTPSEVKGMWWGVLKKGQCLEGNIHYYGDYNSTSYIYSEIDKTHFNKYDVDFLEHYQVILYAFPFIFGSISNVIPLIIIISNKDMQTVPNMYILNLAISDIIHLTVLFSEACANRISDTWLDGEFLCTFLSFFPRMSVGLSAYSVAVFSFQRYRVTVNPFQVRVFSHATCRSTVATICGVWIVSALFAVPSALSKYQCERFWKTISYYRYVVIFELLVSCVLPLSVVAFSYIMTARRLVESSRSISEGTQNTQLKTRRNAAKSVVGLAFVFMISYVPYHVFWTYFIYSEKKYRVHKINDTLDHSNYKFQYTYLISTIFFLINSCFNPVALFCTSSPFRQHLKRYLTCFCKTNSPPTLFELQRRN